MNVYPSVYALFCPQDGTLRYVGSALNGTEERLYTHVTCSGSTPKEIWIRGLRGYATGPIVRVLEYCDQERLLERERWWIDKMLSLGCSLLNDDQRLRRKRRHVR